MNFSDTFTRLFPEASSHEVMIVTDADKVRPGFRSVWLGFSQAFLLFPQFLVLGFKPVYTSLLPALKVVGLALMSLAVVLLGFVWHVLMVPVMTCGCIVFLGLVGRMVDNEDKLAIDRLIREGMGKDE